MLWKFRYKVVGVEVASGAAALVSPGAGLTVEAVLAQPLMSARRTKINKADRITLAFAKKFFISIKILKVFIIVP